MNERMTESKESFIYTNLLPFLLTQIEQADEDARPELLEKVAVLKVFPFSNGNSIEYGALKEDGIDWYYIPKGYNKSVNSTESYRILCPKKMDQKLSDKLLNVFGALLRPYSDDEAIARLVNQMSEETSFNDIWWQKAKEAYRLWNGKDPGARFHDASNNKEEAVMLYSNKYCTQALRKQLQDMGVLSDLQQSSGYKTYMASFSSEDRSKGISFLKHLGIPDSFVSKDDPNALRDELLALLNEMDSLEYPVSEDNPDAYRLCQLVAGIIFDVIRQQHKGLYYQILEDTYVFGNQIAIANVYGHYMPNSVNLFYADDIDANMLSSSPLNEYLLSPKISNEIKDDVAINVSCIQAFDEYCFGDLFSFEQTAFYKWAWSFSQNDDLLKAILTFFTQKKVLGDNIQEWVIDVIEKLPEDGVDSEFAGNRFVAYISAENAVSHAKAIMHARRSLGCDILPVVRSNIQKLALDSKYEIIRAVSNQYGSACADRVAQDPFWSNIYTTSTQIPNAEGSYVVFGHNANSADAGANLLVNQSDDPDEYKLAICDYIFDKYEIHLENITVDWKQEYSDLLRGIDRYICYEQPSLGSSELVLTRSIADDVPLLRDEKRIWHNLENDQHKILSGSVSRKTLEHWREFLESKYHGRCQLCGKRTATGIQNAHFWTYRIVKEKENQLANLSANLFCLCPSCHGELSYGYLGRSLKSIKSKALAYIDEYKSNLDLDDESESTISMFSEYVDDDQFQQPVVCPVIVNGIERNMMFSWEHFINIAFLFYSSGIMSRD